MKNLFFVFALVFFASNLQAQIDSQESSVTIAVEENENSNTTTPLPQIEKPNTNVGLSNTNENTINGISVAKTNTDLSKKEEFSMIYKSDLIDPGTIFEDKWAEERELKEKEKQANSIAVYRKDLGIIETYSDYIIVGLRDYSAIDGDLIRVYSNDGIMHPRVNLVSSYKKIKINLLEGNNVFDFQALNEGLASPNTAEIVILNDKDLILTSNDWNLFTGGIARIKIIKKVKEEKSDN